MGLQRMAQRFMLAGGYERGILGDVRLEISYLMDRDFLRDFNELVR